MASPTEIRKGRVMLYQGLPHLVTDMLHRTQGRQAGFVQVSLRNLNTQTSTSTKIRSTDSVRFCHTQTRKLELSYLDTEGYHFLDPDTFEDTLLAPSLCQSNKKFLIENKLYDILFVDEVPYAVQLPSSVDMEVVEAPEGIRGDTASKVQKPITLQGGLVIQAPLFIQKGDQVKVSTDNATYLGRT